MPKNKGKKKNKRVMDDEVDDWDKSGSEEELISTKDILKKNKKKKGKNKGKNKYQQNENQNDDNFDDSPSNNKQKKKNKKKNKGKNKPQPQSPEPSEDITEETTKDEPEPEQEPEQNDNDLDALEEEEFTKPVKQLSKKERRKLKKLQKQQAKEASPEPDWGEPEDEPRQKGKKKKNKKKNKKGRQQYEDSPEPDWDLPEESPPANQGGKKGKKGKNKNKKKNKKNQKSEKETREEKLAKLKIERQEGLLTLGNNLMLNLDAKFASNFDDEMKETWEATIIDYVDVYDADDWEDIVEDEEFYQEKRDALKEAWDDIMALIEEDFEANQQELDEEARKRAKEKKIKELAALGIRVGGGGTKQPTAAQIKARKKRQEKEKMKALRARLAEADRIAVEQEKKKKEEEEKLRKQKEAEEAKKREEAAKKAAEAEKAKNDDWGDDSSSDESEEEVVKKKPQQKKGRGGNNRGRGKGKGRGGNNNNNNKKKQQAKDAFVDSSDDEWGETSKPKQQPKKQKPQKQNNDPFGDSDDESQQKNRKRGGKGRKKGGGGGDKQQKKASEAQSKSQSPQTKKDKQDTPKAEEKKEEKTPTMEEDKVVDDNNDNDKNKNKGGKGKGKHKGKNKGKGKKKDKKDKKKGKEKVQLRSPICVVMGHVDTGKTKILDHIRSTSVQNKEAGGITQQIGATYLSIDYIKERTARLKEQVNKLKYKVPGLLFIDTPGHESFSNLRSRGSSMCDIAVLVVDLMHGLEPQTIESLKMLKERRCPLVVALNKIDVCYNWKPDKGAPFLTTYNNQEKATKNDFENRLSKVIVEFAEQGENAQLYTKNKRMDRDISLVPTSAITGEGIPDLLYLIVQLTKKYMESKIAYSATTTKASVLEVKQTQGYGATIDVIVSNGELRSDDTIVICGMNGPIVTPIRALLLPHEAQEMRVKGEYRTVHSVTASIGVRIAAVEDLQSAVAGAPLFIVPRNLKPAKMAQKRREVIEDLGDEVQKSFADLFSKVDKGGKGVFVQSSTLGSLEALIGFLHDQKIPVSGIGIGTISKKIIMKAAVMLNFQPEYAVILAFNVRCAPDARQLAQEQNVRIFEAEIIYHLQEMFENYIKRIKEERRHAAKDIAVFPVEMKILSEQHIFNNKNPLVLGVQITRGSLRMNTPICVQKWNAAKVATPLYIGKVDGIKSEDKDVQMAKLNDKVSVRIMGDETQKNIQVGRTFAWTDPLISEISRDSIDALKANFEEEMKEDGDTVPHLVALKKYFHII